MKTIIDFLKPLKFFLIATACALGAVLLAMLISVGTYANPTDWHDNALSEQISRAEQKRRANEIWKQEHGIYQANLTTTAERELREYARVKQAQIDLEAQ